MSPTKFSRRVSLFFAFVFLLFAIFLGINRSSKNNQIDREIQKLKVAGFPTNAEELDAWYRIDSGMKNPASAILEAISLRSQVKWNSTNMPVVGRTKLPESDQPIPENQMAEMKRYLAANQEALSGLMKVLESNPHVARYPIDLSKGPDTKLPHLAGIKSAAQLFKVNAIYQIESKNNQQAVDSVLKSLILARTLRKEPIIISQLVCIAIQVISVSTADQIINRGSGFTMDQLEQLKQAFADGIYPDAVIRGYAGEMAIGLELLLNSSGQNQLNAYGSGVRTIPMVRIGMSLYRGSGLLQNDCLFYLSQMKLTTDSIGLSYLERFEMANESSDKLERTMGDSSCSKRLLLISRRVLPALGNAIGKDLESIAALEVSSTAMAVQQYRLKNNNQFPRKMKDLVPDFLKSIPEDPFTGSPIQFRIRRDTGFVVYSVGMDLKDNQGISRAVKKKTVRSSNREYDLTFTLNW